MGIFLKKKLEYICTIIQGIVRPRSPGLLQSWSKVKFQKFYLEFDTPWILGKK